MEFILSGDIDAKTVLIEVIDKGETDFAFRTAELVKTMNKSDGFLFAAASVDSWNDDLSPWRAPAVFGKEDFGGGARKTLDFIEKNVSGAISDIPEKKIYIGGYSLAGLFSLWAAYNSDMFSGTAAVSPSVWFEGFSDYAASGKIKADAIYLSLGDREEKTKNPVMAKVGDNIRALYSHYENIGVRTTLEWNEGNHFKDAEYRTAKGFAWLLK